LSILQFFPEVDSLLFQLSFNAGILSIYPGLDSGVNILSWQPKLSPDVFFRPGNSSLHLESLKRVSSVSMLLPPRLQRAF